MSATSSPATSCVETTYQLARHRVDMGYSVTFETKSLNDMSDYSRQTVAKSTHANFFGGVANFLAPCCSRFRSWAQFCWGSCYLGSSHNHPSHNTEKFNCESGLSSPQKKVGAQGTEKSAEAIGRSAYKTIITDYQFHNFRETPPEPCLRHDDWSTRCGEFVACPPIQ